ncbi:YfaP family protein [Granulosicoccus antarcticus]|uniref:Uncharacterized protein n=1 Tax=Granulosicoccus antarcticus IMCC3135 TaxID=1192854 RepID=A0A2Z2P8Q1_9GAMM|nr:hypothetical protein [Granulosicoccus antarcticus]ASJ76264.1 hypothetical protein IMCC3135_31075 [Granulosicoccus antarcticus IMCC3135]
MNISTGFGSAIIALTVLTACSSSDDNEPVSDTIPQADVITDPAPLFDAPGEYGCENCPDSDAENFSIATSDTALNFSSSVLGAVGDGEFYILGDDGSAISGVIPTSSTGSFDFTTPVFCGVQIIKCVWSNEAGSYVLITEITRDDCTNAEIQLTLNWDDIGADYELHLIKQGGRINDNDTDCTWTSCIGAGPDWGLAGDTSDNPLKDVDDTGSFGPENIFLNNPENETYTVMVEHWGSGGAESAGNLIFNVAGETTLAEVTNLPSHFVWNVGTIEWPSATVVLDGRIIDCTADWSGGCTLDLPGNPPN